MYEIASCSISSSNPYNNNNNGYRWFALQMFVVKTWKPGVNPCGRARGLADS